MILLERYGIRKQFGVITHLLRVFPPFLPLFGVVSSDRKIPATPTKSRRIK